MFLLHSWPCLGSGSCFFSGFHNLCIKPSGSSYSSFPREFVGASCTGWELHFVHCGNPGKVFGWNHRQLLSLRLYEWSGFLHFLSSYGNPPRKKQKQKHIYWYNLYIYNTMFLVHSIYIEVISVSSIYFCRLLAFTCFNPSEKYLNIRQIKWQSSSQELFFYLFSVWWQSHHLTHGAFSMCSPEHVHSIPVFPPYN